MKRTATVPMVLRKPSGQVVDQKQRENCEGSHGTTKPSGQVVPLILVSFARSAKVISFFTVVSHTVFGLSNLAP